MAESGRPCPYDDANFLSKITFWWMNALFHLGFKNELTPVNICEASKQDRSRLLESKLGRLWKRQVQRHAEGDSPSLLQAILVAFKWQWILPGLCIMFCEAIKLVQPYLIGLLVRYFNSDVDAVSTSTAYGIGACLSGSSLLQVVLNPFYFFVMQHVAMRMKVAVGALIYRKVLTLSTKALYHTSAGQIVNHLSTDVEKFSDTVPLLHYFWISPLSVIIAIYLMYREVGLSCLWGLAVVALLMSLQSGLSSLFGKLRKRIGAYSDKRIQLMTEVIMAMKIIKMHCWEQPFQNLLSNLRRSESAVLRWSGLVHAVMSGLLTVCSRLAVFGIVLALWVKGAHIEPADVFTSMAWLLVLESVLSRFPFELKKFQTLYRSAQFVQAFLLLDEENEHIKDLQLDRSISFRNEPQNDWAVDVERLTARWPSSSLEGKKRFLKKRQRSSTSSMRSLLHESDADHAFSLKYVSFLVNKGELLVVVGIVGSGKSSLLLSLAGELPYDTGQISVNGKISYCGQTSWILSGTVKDNIVFGNHFDRNRYQDVIRVCGLSHDMELFPRGDMTFVGERGLHLSGGQKARISLARCVYHEADVFLLDDPLSAVDTSVGRHIFDRCIRDFLREKTVILVTHQLQYLKQADKILVLRDGSVHDVGTYDELKSRGMDMKALLSHDSPKHVSEAKVEAEEEENQMLLESKSPDLQEDREEEESLSGSVGLKVYWKYFCSGFGHLLLPVLLPLWFAGPALYCLSDAMLAEWAGEHEYQNPDDGDAKVKYNAMNGTASPVISLGAKSENQGSNWDSMSSNMQFYIIFLLASLGGYILYAAVYLQMAATASRRIHDQMLERIMNTVCHFFDVHSVGQILNRFSRDLSLIDDVVSVVSYFFTMKSMQFFGFFVLTLYVNPWLTFAFVPVMIVILLVRIYALRTMRQIKRLEAKARSPVYTHVSETVLGLETIRAFRKQEQFLAEFDAHQDNHTAAWFLYLSAYRWMSIRTLASVVIYLIVIVFTSLALKNSLDGNLIALSLIYCISMCEPFEYFMRMSADLEMQMTSVERVLAYCELEQEPPKVSDKPPSPDWPNRGAITFSDTCLKYSSSKGAPLTLKHIDCHIQGKEKIGIVGRTGSGKSSLVSSLFRLAQPTGIILIDGMETSRLGLHELRSKMSIIPQDPMLFSQTLRWNLDPLDEFSDERLWNALEQVKLKSKVDCMPGKLYTDMGESGISFSAGQKQLICLARAILKYNHILVLDEATANVDEETDSIIQRTIRAKFRDSTVLTVAHRLFTVIDCDRIMVLEEGELREFDTPYKLLQNPEGVFTRLVLNTGKNQAKQLQALADLSQYKRASANIHLQRAMILANEQLAQSTEDLTVGTAALNWNRFTHSQDSLDKAQVDHIVETEKKPTVGPSQRIIRRRSPGRPKRTTEETEEDELLSYDRPPTAHGRVRSDDDSDKLKSPEGKSDKSDVSQPLLERDEGSPQSRSKDKSKWARREPEQHSMRREDRREFANRERNGGSSSSSSPTVTHSPVPSPANRSEPRPEDSDSPRPRQTGRRYQSRPGQRANTQNSNVKNGAHARATAGQYAPVVLREDEKEQFV